MIWSDLHGDMESPAEMTGPLASLWRAVTTMNGPKVIPAFGRVLPLGAATRRCAAGHLLETPSIRRYSSAKAGSENPSGAGNQQERLEGTGAIPCFENPQRPYASQLGESRVEDMVLAPWRHGDQLERNSLSGKFRPARMV